MATEFPHDVWERVCRCCKPVPKARTPRIEALLGICWGKWAQLLVTDYVLLISVCLPDWNLFWRSSCFALCIDVMHVCATQGKQPWGSNCKGRKAVSQAAWRDTQGQLNAFLWGGWVKVQTCFLTCWIVCTTLTWCWRSAGGAGTARELWRTCPKPNHTPCPLDFPQL